MTDRADLLIIERVKHGDINAYKELVDKYNKPLFVMIMNVVRHRESSEEIVQEVFFSTYTCLDRFDPSLAKFSTWLFRIARNRCLNELKRSKEDRIQNVDSHASVHNPADDVMTKEVFSELDMALDKLPVHQKTVFVLTEIQELSLAEVSEIEEVPVGTVKSRLSRAKEKLRILLNGYLR